MEVENLIKHLFHSDLLNQLGALFIISFPTRAGGILGQLTVLYLDFVRGDKTSTMQF